MGGGSAGGAGQAGAPAQQQPLSSACVEQQSGMGQPGWEAIHGAA